MYRRLVVWVLTAIEMVFGGCMRDEKTADD
ncbi:hypothetical protein H4W33_006596 [Kibdelosporangium phytohabitans]|nr:hypothetical protein [Kibdelosporangium phytohabitans]